MKLVYYVHPKQDKGQGNCNAIIGKEEGPFYTIHMIRKQKESTKVEFKPAFLGYETGMIKAPMTDSFLAGKFIVYLSSLEKVTTNEKE